MGLTHGFKVELLKQRVRGVHNEFRRFVYKTDMGGCEYWAEKRCQACLLAL